MTSGYLPSTVGGGDLVAELASTATQAGPNTGLWPGLTIYRFTGLAAQGRITDSGREQLRAIGFTI